MTLRLRTAARIAVRAGGLIGAAGPVAIAMVAASGTPAGAETPEEKFVRDIENSNAVVTSIPGTPDRWIAAGYTSCGRITSTVAQGLPLRAAVNNEVIAATTFNVISRQDAVALVTYAVLDLCPQVMRDAAAPPAPPAPAG